MKIFIVLVAGLSLLFAGTLYTAPARTQGEILATSTPKEVVVKLTHQQEVWLGALEWCESRGKPTAINPKDRDGTPSYGGFQFKPTTLEYFAQTYKIATSTVMDYSTQRKVVEAMVLDSKHIDWHQQFPDCVRKNGPPPA